MTNLQPLRAAMTTVGLLLSLSWLGPSRALAESTSPGNGRAFSVGVSAGLRSFDSDLDLEREAAVGLRLLGALRPYVIAGVGGLLFDFSDASDAAGGTLTLGGGIELRPARRLGLYLEGSADLYRARTVLYSSTGAELSATERSTRTATSALAGVAWEF